MQKPTTMENGGRMRIDGHAHVFLTSLPMPVGRRYSPECDATIAAYCGHLEANGLDGALLVQPSFLGIDNSFMLDAIAGSRTPKSTIRLWGVVVVDPTMPLDHMSAMKAQGIVGARLNLFKREIPDLAEPVWRTFLERVETIGWHLEVHIEGPRLPQVLDDVCTICSRVVVDHFGLPDADAPLQCAGFRKLLNHKGCGLFVKTSAPYRVFPGETLDRAARFCTPLMDALEDALGPDRLIWGSDWPWTQNERGQRYADTLRWAGQNALSSQWTRDLPA